MTEQSEKRVSWRELKLDKTDLDGVAGFGDQGFARFHLLVVDIGSVAAVGVYNMPVIIAKAQFGMDAGNEAIGKLNGVGGAAPDTGFRHQVETGAGGQRAGATDDDQMAQNRGAAVLAGATG